MTLIDGKKKDDNERQRRNIECKKKKKEIVKEKWENNGRNKECWKIKLQRQSDYELCFQNMKEMNESEKVGKKESKKETETNRKSTN